MSSMMPAPILGFVAVPAPLPSSSLQFATDNSLKRYGDKFRSAPIVSPARRPRPPTLALSLPSPSPVVIIGGGAAGFLCAITLSRRAGSRAHVTILEGSSSVLEKVRISGGGRCNVTSALEHDDHRAFSAHYARGSYAMPAVLSRFGPADVVRFFEQEGVPLKTEPSGKLFPMSDSSSSVVDALVNAAKRAGVGVGMRKRVVDVTRRGERFLLSIAGGEEMEAEYVVISTGSARPAHNWAKRFGHAIVPPVPSLFTFRVDDASLHALAGVAVDDCAVSLRLPRGDASAAKKRRRGGRGGTGLTQRGPLLVTHWGLSGPAVLTLSAFGARELHGHKYRMACTVDWVPALTREEKVALLRSARVTLSQKNIATVSPFRRKFPNRLWRYLIEGVQTLSTAQKWKSLRNENVEKLADVLHCSVFEITGKGEFKEEFVTAGGVALNGINTKTFESKQTPGLYFAGETLDVDGRTGGYNLEFAWSSGFIAGSSIAERLLDAVDVELSTTLK